MLFTRPCGCTVIAGSSCPHYVATEPVRIEVNGATVTLVGEPAMHREGMMCDAHAFEKVISTELAAMAEHIAKQVAAGTHDALGEPLHFRGHEDDQPHPDEALRARCDALCTALRNVLRLCVDRRAHYFAEAQEALNVADAVLVESEGVK